jgi:hypothetical protein
MRALAAVDREQRVVMAAGYPVNDIAQLARDAVGKLPLNSGKQH